MNTIPPANFLQYAAEAQASALAALRADLTVAGAALSVAGITEQHFGDERRLIFMALMEAWTAAEPFSIRPLMARLRVLGCSLDGHAVLGFFAESAPAHTLPTTIAALHRCLSARRLYALAKQLRRTAFDLTEETDGIITAARAALDAVNAEPEPENTSLAHFLKEAVEALEGHATSADVIEFGLGLDAIAGPFMRGDLIVIAAKTKGGKSAIAGNIVENVAANGLPCVLFSLEMSGMQTAERMMASQARVDLRSFKLRRRLSGEMNFTSQDEAEMARLERNLAEMVKWPVHIFTKKNSVATIAAEIIRRKPALAVVDYAQLTEGIRAQGDNREREVASISATLKKTAMSAHCVVILLSQLNDNGLLRESRALGQDANCVLFIDGEEHNSRTVRVGAARSAPSGTEMELAWHPAFTRFSSAD